MSDGYHEFMSGLTVLVVLGVVLVAAIPGLCRWLSDVLGAHSIAARHFWRLIGEAARMYRDTYAAEREWATGQKRLEMYMVRTARQAQRPKPETSPAGRLNVPGPAVMGIPGRENLHAGETSA